jgi:hypothetical protein
MRIQETRASVEPSQDRLTLDARGPIADHCRKGSIPPLTEIIDETVVLRIAVDIDNEMVKVKFMLDRNTMKGMFEKATGTSVPLVKRLSIGPKKTRELAARRAFFRISTYIWCSRPTPLLLQGSNANHQMEVILQQAIGVHLCNWFDVAFIAFQKVDIIAPRVEEVFTVRATIIDVIGMSISERRWIRHSMLLE